MDECNISRANYSETILRIIISDVNRIFSYWNISEEYNNSFIQKYGKDFFENTKEFLILRNLSNNKDENIEIKEPTNNYYIKIKNARAIYQVILRRLGKEDNKDYGYEIRSNIIKTPGVKIKLDSYTDESIKFFNFNENTKISETYFFKRNKNNKESIEKLYNEQILNSWGEYKKENGYREK